MVGYPSNYFKKKVAVAHTEDKQNEKGDRSYIADQYDMFVQMMNQHKSTSVNQPASSIHVASTFCFSSFSSSTWIVDSG